MKKYLFIIVVITLFVLMFIKFGYKRMLTPGAVQKVRVNSIEQLKDRANDSEKKFKKELETADKVGTNFKNLGVKYINNRNWTPGILAFTKAIEYGKSSARVHHFLGAAYGNRYKELSNKSDIIKAEKHYKRAIEINPKLLDAKYGLSILTFYFKKNMKKEAIKSMKEVVRKDENFFDADFALARFYYEEGEKARALSVYEELYSKLKNLKETRRNIAFKKKCSENITRLMMEVSLKR